MIVNLISVLIIGASQTILGLVVLRMGTVFQNSNHPAMYRALKNPSHALRKAGQKFHHTVVNQKNYEFNESLV